MAKNILLILTGGTICSFATSKGEQASNTKEAETLIVNNFRNSDCQYRSEEYVKFKSEFPLDVLSENMTIEHWNVLIKNMKSYDYSEYDGVIILHGTDTLAYTASMLSGILSGLPIPVILVSSQLAPYKPEANGNANFKAAVELIVNGIKPNVYAVYRNEETNNYTKSHTMYVHYGAHLKQCANLSNNFYSQDMTAVSSLNAVFEGKKSCEKEPLLFSEKFEKISAKVLKIQPYVGLDYSKFVLDDVDAVIHGTYHSSTMAIDTDVADKDNHICSILHLKEMCDNCNPKIPLFIEPYTKTTYETTGEAIRHGIIPIMNLTSEMAYVKALIGCSLGYTGDELAYYINEVDINNEFLH